MTFQNILKASASILFISSALGCSSNGGLGSQIDRMGRPAVNTALNNTFTDDATRGAAENNYNQTGNSNSAQFIPQIAGNLAIYDALADNCGDNPLTNRAGAANADLATGANRYDFLATVLADDEIYVNGAATGGCTQYLAAELTVLGVGGLDNDCGGRAPTYDVIETTYSAVAIGGVTGVDDGVSADDVAQSDTAFPFLAAPL